MLEILENSNFYNMNLNDYEDLIKDSRIITPNFDELCRSGSCCGSYVDMICIYALSAVICKPLKLFIPSTRPLDNRSNTYSRSVIGRGVSQRCIPPFVIMWTSVTPLSIKDDFINFTPNHFVILQKIKPV